MLGSEYFPTPTYGPTEEYGKISDFLGMAINIMLGVAFGLGFVSVAMSLVKMVLSQGDPKATQGAFNGIKWGIIAIAISLFVFTVKTIVVELVGITGMDDATPSF